jgi:rubrerythrin
MNKTARFVFADNLPQWDNDDMDFVRRAVAAEADAVNLYENQAEKTESDFVRRILLHIAKEEKQHLSELYMILRKMDPEQMNMENEAVDDLEKEMMEG